MSEAATYSEEFGVRVCDTDPWGRATVRTLLLLLQEAATSHATDLGVAVDYLIENRLAWVMVRLQVSMTSWPHGGDTIAVETWVHSASRVMTERRFRVIGGGGAVLGDVVTQWVILDTARRRPVRLPKFALDAIAPVVRAEKPVSLDEIPELDASEHDRTFEVRFSDLDIAQHVNNAAYIQWISETVPEEKLRTHIPHRIDAHYLAECRFGDVVDSRSAETAGGFLHSLRRRSDGAEVLRARTRWTPGGGGR
jgi:acyl-ACP thioesterase